MECPADSLASMIDIAKVVDIVLLMIDGNYGFEMETMEFLNVLSASGMPGNVFGILTHLDLFKKVDTLKMQKKYEVRFSTNLISRLYFVVGGSSIDSGASYTRARSCSILVASRMAGIRIGRS